MSIRYELERLSAVDAARRLLGCELLVQGANGDSRVRIVETEAYDQSDAASHSYNGSTKRTDVMFGPAGHLYVYFTYGMHYCMNIVVGKPNYGAAVLIRAVEPIEGENLLLTRRPKTGVELTNGPAKLCQALGIDTSMNGHDLSLPPCTLVLTPALRMAVIGTSLRIGISKATTLPWRFYVRDSPYLSRIPKLSS